MRSSIDRAGRTLIPAAIRQRAGFSAGADLEITEDGLGIRIQRVAADPRLVKVVV